MGYYWMYYAASLLAAYAIRNPWVAGVCVAFILVRRWLPDPVVLFGTLSRIGRLKSQVHLNPANVIARRDLARAYLDLRRPGAALHFLDEAAARDPRDFDVAYLRGMALLRLGKNDEALRALGSAVGIDPDDGEPFSDLSKRGGSVSVQRHAEAYLAAATALERLGRDGQAEEALMMSASTNSSTLEPLVRLARLRRKRGDEAGADRAVAEARSTWSALPSFARRRQIGWRLRAMIA
jgi:tetratricopeptide (TPR) repeat protein